MNPPPPAPPPPAFQEEPPTTFLDPHASKIAPDDPRLQLARAAGRTLKKGPAIAIATSLLTALGGAGALALQPASGPKLAKADLDPAASAQNAVPPESLQNAVGSASSSLRAPSAALATEPSARTMPLGAGAAGSGPDRQRELRADEDEKALSGPILFDTRAAGAPPIDAPAAALAALATAAAPAAAASHPPDDDPNRQTRKNDFLESDSPSGELGATLQHPSSPTEVMAGTIIPAVLLTAVNSDVPGPVIAQVRENVYDTVTGR